MFSFLSCRTTYCVFDGNFISNPIESPIRRYQREIELLKKHIGQITMEIVKNILRGKILFSTYLDKFWDYRLKWF
ncbi:MAG: hypothetical protein ACFE9X_11560 [Promethearchaeota archaeon]